MDEVHGVNVFDSVDYLQGNGQTFFFPLGVSQRFLRVLNVLLVYPHPQRFNVTQLHLNVEVLHGQVDGRPEE